ncbi:carboxymuconolactone decarboxylase family protein [Flavobacterium sp. MAH-1]|uniref:Carboxymuconolactone decarboxylase family protein n=1 Tax=Flavobacterium agri TaxID=2743471 RepID=A0A7Y9C6I1_9FLAO|nr:carboxymuconolactone decarboxylase family protein [Flavobacterium agri]NUY80358.1 carboxymuconolactone decarboxylase family protein [Flavobacterium agri]NYA70383.1 carboxymuconolactone decarboxylase family protein [Flavobacterium agri]
MKTRLNIFEKGKDALRPLFGVGAYINKSTIDASLRHLVEVRVSQINGCAYCLDMHYKEARAIGETEQRLYGLSSWKEAPYYTERERAALAWAEALTKTKVSEKTYALASAHFSEQELIDLTIVVTGINTWNRIQLAFPSVAGSYQPGQFN